MSVTVLTSALLALWVQGPARSLKVPDEPHCERCEIVVTRVGRIGAPDGDNALLRTPGHVVRDASGRLFVSYPEGGPPVVFDATAKFLRNVGRQGNGPGEIQAVTQMQFDAHDSLFLHDASSARVSVFSPGGERFVRSYPVRAAMPTGSLFLSSKRLLVGQFGDGNARAPTIDMYASDGQRVRSFGNKTATKRGLRPHTRYLLASARAEGIWAAWSVEHVIEKWSETGVQLVVLNRESEWFAITPRDEYGGGMATVRALREDTQRRLWTLVSIPKQGWKRFANSANDAERLRLDAMLSTVIEVVDHERGRVVARKRVPEFLTWILSDSLIAGYREDDDGIPWIDLYAARVVDRK